MTSSRSGDVESICLQALSRRAEERSTFLDEACAGNLELRRDVEALVARAAEFLEPPGWAAPSTPIEPGTRLGPYEIQAAIGAGGMGQVYAARDTRLDRLVAIKFLLAGVSADPERRARFEREAKTIGGLNHPHICALFDVGEHDNSTYLVMEHLQGTTLARRLDKGRLPLEQALTTAAEIAEALAAAHRQGVIHRDLKPSNVMLTKTGAKLLDFGLAKLTETAAAKIAPRPTGPTTLTAQGMIVGTLQYMAPEQVEGKPVDARTDLWALGAVLYEIVTGKPAFEGSSAVSLMVAILEHEPPPMASLLPLTPPALDRLVRRCLAKSPDDRPDGAHDVADELRWIRGTGLAGTLKGAEPRPGRGRQLAVRVLGLAAAALMGAGAMWLLRPNPPGVYLARPSLDVSPAEELNGGGLYSPAVRTPGGSRTSLAWTPDGTALVFVGRRGDAQQLYVRRLDAAEARPLPNTEGAQVPAVSTDGQWVAFWAASMIRKIPLGGGPVTDLAPGLARPPKGLAWSSDGRLFFGNDNGRIWAIPVQGSATAVTAVGEAEIDHTLPWPLPGGRTLVYTVRKRRYSWGDEEVVAETLATGQRKTLLRDAADARYVPGGYLVFLRRGTLFALPFDPEKLERLGPEVAVLGGVAQSLSAGNAFDVTGAGQFAVSGSGVLAWVPGPIVQYSEKTLVSVDRRGQVAQLPAPVRSYAPSVRLSPDRRQLLVLIYSLTERGLWVADLSSGKLRQLSLGGEAYAPFCWFPDGRRVTFSWLKDGRPSLAAQPADGTAPPQVLLEGDLVPMSFTPDGRQVAVSRREEDIGLVTLGAGRTLVQPLIETPRTEGGPEFSPDGMWLAYASDDSGRFEVYVRRHPGPGASEPVSLEGGGSPAWNPNGRELFFVSLPDAAGKQRLMAVDFEPGPRQRAQPRIGRPRTLFEFSNAEMSLDCRTFRCYDVAQDGQRFYATARAPTFAPLPDVTHIRLITNWLEELKTKVSPAR